MSLMRSMDDKINDDVAVVEVQVPLPLPLDVVVGEGCRLQYGHKSWLSPCERARHDSTFIVKSPHCPSILAIRIPAAKII